MTQVLPQWRCWLFWRRLISSHCSSERRGFWMTSGAKRKGNLVVLKGGRPYLVVAGNLCCRVRKTWVRARQAVWPWTGDFTSLCLCFLLNIMGFLKSIIKLSHRCCLLEAICVCSTQLKPQCIQLVWWEERNRTRKRNSRQNSTLDPDYSTTSVWP